MSNAYFRFRRFTVYHDRCAMKVGTDGVLLGAWAPVGGQRVLDIGTGTGLIALMAAQRNAGAQVVAIDVDEAAVRQARENVAGSPFADRIAVQCQDVLTYAPGHTFDAILCNPPFFTEDTLPPDDSRALARNSQLLPFDRLIARAAALLAPDGRFSVIIPSAATTDFIALCLREGLHLQQRCNVRTVQRKPVRRVLLSFGRDARAQVHDEDLLLMDAEGHRSIAYAHLAADFYL